MKKNIAIIDYGVGNTHSVKEALSTLDCQVTISNDPEKLAKADALILPGVGAFEAAMHNLEERNLIAPLQQLVLEEKKPILGICLGMQLLADLSEENGTHRGLGWIPGKVIRIKGDEALRVPHVGWNDIQIFNRAPLFERLQGSSNFYFDHSYHFSCRNEKDIAAKVNYGEGLVAAVQRDNIHGVQFHPEKSQITGLRLLKGFINSLEC
jgi:glutamine amidotransferase